jgi:hypothetical protein
MCDAVCGANTVFRLLSCGSCKCFGHDTHACRNLGRRRCLRKLRVYVLNLLQIILVGSGGTVGGWAEDE